MSKLKGFSVTALVIILAVVAVAAIVLLLGFGGFGWGGGKGDGEGDGDSTIAAVSAEPEETEATPAIENIEYINVAVSGNEYIYDNQKLSLEELISRLANTQFDDIPIKITDDDAALDAYQQLIDELEKHNIKYIEETMI